MHCRKYGEKVIKKVLARYPDIKISKAHQKKKNGRRQIITDFSVKSTEPPENHGINKYY